MSEKKGLLMAGLAVLAWSTVAAAFKISLRFFSAVQLLWVVSAVSTLVLGTLLLWKILFAGKRYGLDRFVLLRSALLGFLNPFIYYLLVFASYERLLAQVAQPLNQIWGILLAVISAWRFGRRIHRPQWFGMGLSFLGVLVLVTQGRLSTFRLESPLGVTFALASAFVWAYYWLINMDDSVDPLWRLFLNCGFGFVYISVLMVLGGNWNLDISLVGWGSAIYIGFFEMGLTTLVWLIALKTVADTTKVSGLIYLIPFGSLFFISQVAGERIRIASVLGLILVVAGQVLIHRKRQADPFELSERKRVDKRNVIG